MQPRLLPSAGSPRPRLVPTLRLRGVVTALRPRRIPSLAHHVRLPQRPGVRSPTVGGLAHTHTCHKTDWPRYLYRNTSLGYYINITRASSRYHSQSGQVVHHTNFVNVITSTQ
jgi:hypothetical protein